MKKLVNSFIVLIFTGSIFAKSNAEKIGDILQLAIPISAYATTLYFDDKEGQYQFYKSYGTAILSTVTLKYIVKEKRPDSNSRDSFPSGHTSSAFAGASFIHKRYGFKYAVLPYMLAIYTGYSRVHSNRHYTRDVIAGALIGIASSWYFVTPYRNLNILPEVGSGYAGVRLNYKW